MEIADRARKHGIALLEIVMLDGDNDDERPTAIHAMPLRRKFHNHLR